MQATIKEQERVVASAKTMAEQGDSLVKEKLELKEVISVLEREKREALFQASR